MEMKLRVEVLNEVTGGDYPELCWEALAPPDDYRDPLPPFDPAKLRVIEPLDWPSSDPQFARLFLHEESPFTKRGFPDDLGLDHQDFAGLIGVAPEVVGVLHTHVTLEELWQWVWEDPSTRGNFAGEQLWRTMRALRQSYELPVYEDTGLFCRPASADELGILPCIRLLAWFSEH